MHTLTDDDVALFVERERDPATAPQEPIDEALDRATASCAARYGWTADLRKAGRDFGYKLAICNQKASNFGDLERLLRAAEGVRKFGAEKLMRISPQIVAERGPSEEALDGLKQELVAAGVEPEWMGKAIDYATCLADATVTGLDWETALAKARNSGS